MSTAEPTVELTQEQQDFAAALIAGLLDDVDDAIERAVAPLKSEIAALRAELDGQRND